MTASCLPGYRIRGSGCAPACLIMFDSTLSCIQYLQDQDGVLYPSKVISDSPARLHDAMSDHLQDQDDLLYPSNIMFDRRIVRGNTYSAQILPAEAVMAETKQR